MYLPAKYTCLAAAVILMVCGSLCAGTLVADLTHYHSPAVVFQLDRVQAASGIAIFFGVAFVFAAASIVITLEELKHEYHLARRVNDAA